MYILRTANGVDGKTLTGLLEAGRLVLGKMPAEIKSTEITFLLASRDSGGEAADLVAETYRAFPECQLLLCCPRPTEREREVLCTVGTTRLVEPAGLAPEQFAVRLLSEVLPDLNVRQSLEALYGGSARMQRLYEEIELFAPLSDPVLLIGETGTGKDLVARAIHTLGRRSKPWVALNVSAASSDLVSSDLFGHEAGAFTGASKSRRGLFGEAADGTVFLDEIGDLDERSQVKLLRVIEDRRFRPVGGNKEELLNARVVLATHRDLERMIEDGRFRQDLYERIRGFQIAVPPLRERMEDIPTLARHFLQQFDDEFGGARDFPLTAIDLLFRWQWPGNVRELRGVIRRAAAASKGSRNSISHAVLREAIKSRVSSRVASESRAFDPTVEVWATVERRLKKSYFQRALELSNGKASAAADMAGISRARFYELVRDLGIEIDQSK